MIKERNFWLFLILSIITCGIYSIIFWYNWVEDTNRMLQGDGNDSQNYIIVILLSIITCGIYGWIWYYKMGERLHNNAGRYGIVVSETGTTILLWFVLGAFLAGIGPLVAQYFMIENTNKYAAVYNQTNFGGAPQA